MNVAVADRGKKRQEAREQRLGSYYAVPRKT